MSKIEKWLCSACKFTLGMVEDKSILRIKRKDLYVSIEGGKVSEVCPRCGKVNVIEDETPAGQPVTTPPASA